MKHYIWTLACLLVIAGLLMADSSKLMTEYKCVKNMCDFFYSKCEIQNEGFAL